MLKITAKKDTSICFRGTETNVPENTIYAFAEFSSFMPGEIRSALRFYLSEEDGKNNKPQAQVELNYPGTEDVREDGKIVTKNTIKKVSNGERVIRLKDAEPNLSEVNNFWVTELTSLGFGCSVVKK